MKHTIYFSDTREDTKNCLYPHAADLLDSEQLHTALQYDHVLAEYKNGYRTRENFIRATVIGIDIDNDHSDNEDHWISSDDLRAMLPTVSYVLVYSRHHLQEKGSGSRRKDPEAGGYPPDLLSAAASAGYRLHFQCRSYIRAASSSFLFHNRSAG